MSNVTYRIDIVEDITTIVPCGMNSLVWTGSIAPNKRDWRGIRGNIRVFNALKQDKILLVSKYNFNKRDYIAEFTVLRQDIDIVYCKYSERELYKLIDIFGESYKLN
jgi:hypothetical protein